MKKKEYTFADEAKAIQKRFPRRESDSIEKRDYKDAMQRLMQEQEQVRAEKGMDNTNQYTTGGPYNQGYIKEDNRNLLERWGDKVYGTYETNKPQLFKDFPITDIVGTGLQYITGNTPDTGMQTGMPGFLPTMGAGAYPNAGSYLDDASKFVGDPSGIGQLVKRSTKVGRNIQPNTRLSNIEATKTYVPAKSRFRTANPDLVEDYKRTSEKISANRAVQKELDKAFGRTGKGTTKIGNLNSPATGGLPSNLQMINGKLYQVDPTTGTKIPWKNIGYGATVVGASGAGLYGVSQLNPYEPSSTQQPINNPLDLSGYNIDEVYRYINSLYGNGPLHPNQLAARGEPWNRPNTEEPTTRNTTQTTPSTGGTTVPPQDESVRDDRFPDTNLMGLRYGDRVYTRPGEDIGARVGGTFASGASPKIDIKTNPPAQKPEIEKLKSWGKSQVAKATEMSDDTWYNRNKKYLPTVASGLSTILGNALLARSFKSNYRTSVPKYSPEEINLEPQAEGFRKDADVSKAVLSRNARNLGLNAGQTMANITAGRTMIDRNLGNLLTNLYTQQEGTNVGAANQFASQHMDALGRARMYDTRYNQMEKMNRLGYLSGMFNTIPGMASEYNLMNRDEETRRWWNNYLDSIGNHYRLNDPLGYNPQINLR